MNLLTCHCGSVLYGTNTENSDTDLFYITLPPLDSLLLGEGVKTIVEKTNSAAGVKNTKYDIDKTFMPIQVFAKEFVDGTPRALEIASLVMGENKQAIISVECPVGQTSMVNGVWKAKKCTNWEFSYWVWADPLIFDFISGLVKKFSTSDIPKTHSYLRYGRNVIGDKHTSPKERMHLLRILHNAREQLSTGGIQLPYSSETSEFLLKVKNDEVPIMELDKIYQDGMARVEYLMGIRSLPTHKEVAKEFQTFTTEYMKSFYLKDYD